MNYIIGSPSRPPHYTSSSSSNEDSYDDNIIAQRNALCATIANNNSILSQHLIKNNSWGGSVPGRITINRDREAANRNLFIDYFAPNPIFNDTTFRKRFRMGRDLFLRIFNVISHYDNYFVQKRDAYGKVGLSGLQKTTTVFRMLAYGLPADATDGYIKIGESTVVESMKRFCHAIVVVFGEQYLRAPNANDIAQLLRIGKSRGFLDMLGSLDCMHWKWKNCPAAWAGQYAGSNNDINVLEASHLFSNLAQGIAPPAHYVIQGKEYHMNYYLADGIYPKWATLVQSIREPRGAKKKLFAAKQESCRKNVERAFGVLKSRFVIIAGPSRFWKKKVLHDILSACIIMHNMIIEDEHDINAPVEEGEEVPATNIEMVVDENVRFRQFLARYKQIKNKDAHMELRNALIEHLWERHDNCED